MAGEIVPAKQSADNALIALIATAAQDQSIDVAKLQQLVELRERILAKEAEIAFNVAMNEAQGEMTPILKDAKNPHAGNRYATLEQVDKEIRPIYSKHGFCLTFNTATPASVGAVHVTCEVRHSAGHKKEYYLEGDLDVSGSQGKSNKTSIQGLGSSVSYLRRYLTLMIFNLTLTNEDNDGNGNRPGWGDSGSKAASDAVRDRQLADIAARRAAAYEPGLQPPHDTQLKASVEAVTGKEKPTLSASYITMLEWFGDFKKKFRAAGMEYLYYKILGEHGVCHANEFPSTKEGGKQARACQKAMAAAYHLATNQEAQTEETHA